MTTEVLTEGKHAGEFIISEANGSLSREKVILASGQNVVDGQLVKTVTGKVRAMADLDSEDQVTGIVIGNHNVSADTEIVIIARLAEVRASALTFGTNTSEDTEDELLIGLAEKFIIPR